MQQGVDRGQYGASQLREWRVGPTGVGEGLVEHRVGKAGTEIRLDW